MKGLYTFLDYVVPRFTTDWFVLVDEGEYLEPICAVQDLAEWEFYPGLVFQKWRTFNLLGYGIFPTAIGDTYQVNSYHDLSSLMKL